MTLDIFAEAATDFAAVSIAEPIGKILVTGDRGRIGSRVCEQLQALNYEVVGYDLADGYDIADLAKLTERTKGCECIIHLAAIPHPQKGSMVQYFEVNVTGTLNVLRAAEANKVKRVVYSSSTGYYGTDTGIHGFWRPQYLPIDERHPPQAVTGLYYGGLQAYNQSKVMAEQLLAWYGSNGVVQTVALRIAPANSKGEQFKKGNIKALPRNDWRLVGLLVNCHPVFAAAALVRACDLSLDLPGYSAYNICDRYLPRGFTPDLALAMYGAETSLSMFSSEKAERVLGWSPCEER